MAAHKLSQPASDLICLSEMSSPWKPSTLQDTALRSLSEPPRISIPRSFALPNIIWRDGDRELFEFPSELREQLLRHVKSHHLPSLKGVASKGVSKPFNSTTSHFRTVEGIRLLAARYKYGSRYEMTVVAGKPGSDFNDGKAAIIVHNKSFAQTIVEGIRYRRVDYKVWQPDEDATSMLKVHHVHRYIEFKDNALGKGQDRSDEEQSEHDDHESGLPFLDTTFHFTKVEGNAASAFPPYLSEEIKQFVETESTLPSCARRKVAGRGLFLKDGKPIQYRDKETQEILKAGRYECQGKFYDIVRATGARSRLLGEVDLKRDNFTREDGTRVCVSSYYVWSGEDQGRTRIPQIEKWTFQSTLDDPKPTLERFPRRRETCRKRDLRTNSRRLGTADNSDAASSLLLHHDASGAASPSESVEPTIEGYHDEDADDSEAKCSPTPPNCRIKPPQTKYSRSSPRSISTTPTKRQRTDNSGFCDKETDNEALSRKSHPAVHVPKVESTFKIRELKHESKPEHHFVLKASLTDESVYPPKSIGICNEVSLLFQHAIQAKIADKTTTLLVLLGGNGQTWFLVRGDSDEFERVVAWLKAAEISQRIVVTPDMN